MDIYVVQPGDTVDIIAAANQIPKEVLVYDNQIEAPYRLAVGQALFIDNSSDTRDNFLLYTSGYAYPNINSITLDQTLPWLTSLYVFSYGFTVDGDLVHPKVDDTWMVNAIIAGGARPILTLTPLDANGAFDNNLVTILVENPEVQERLIGQLKAEMWSKGYRGLDIDFEYVLATDRDDFSAFVEKLVGTMNLSGFDVTVAMAPKTSEDQPGVLYEGIDYGRLGAAANRVMLMTYEWGYTYGCIRWGEAGGRSVRATGPNVFGNGSGMQQSIPGCLLRANFCPHKEADKN